MVSGEKRTKWEHWTGLRKKDLDDMKKVDNIDELFARRNLIAHQSQAQFAELLIDPVFAEHQRQRSPADTDWKSYYAPLFAYVYKDQDGFPMTLEQCASLSEEALAPCIPKAKTKHPDYKAEVQYLG
ncbi:MAG: hypothetical protein Q9182_002743 [Xanthomendoza sp. 2 TL-2023]